MTLPQPRWLTNDQVPHSTRRWLPGECAHGSGRSAGGCETDRGEVGHHDLLVDSGAVPDEGGRILAGPAITHEVRGDPCRVIGDRHHGGALIGEGPPVHGARLDNDTEHAARTGQQWHSGVGRNGHQWRGCRDDVDLAVTASVRPEFDREAAIQERIARNNPNHACTLPGMADCCASDEQASLRLIGLIGGHQFGSRVEQAGDKVELGAIGDHHPGRCQRRVRPRRQQLHLPRAGAHNDQRLRRRGDGSSHAERSECAPGADRRCHWWNARICSSAAMSIRRMLMCGGTCRSTAAKLSTPLTPAATSRSQHS